jgi:hypothetical protein
LGNPNGQTNRLNVLPNQFPGVRFPNDKRLAPTGEGITVEAWVFPDAPNGAIVAHGTSRYGYALALRDGFPVFHIRNAGNLVSVAALSPLTPGWHYLVGVLDADRDIRLYVDGHFVNDGHTTALLDSKPATPLEFGVDSGDGGAGQRFEGGARDVNGGIGVGDYGVGNPYAGLLDEVAVYYRALSTEEIQQRALEANANSAPGAAIACSFDNNDARDDSTNHIDGVLRGVDIGKGKKGAALWFHRLSLPELVDSTNGSQSVASKAPLPAEQGDLTRGGALSGTSTPGANPASGSVGAGGTNALARRFRNPDATNGLAAGPSGSSAPGGTNAIAQQQGGTFVKYDWTSYVPVSTRGLSMSGTNLVVAGPPDLVNEEQIFKRLTEKDPTVQKELDEQDASLAGKRGALVKIFNKGDGQVTRDFTIDSPPVWDGVSVAQGRIFIVTEDGKIRCYGQPPKPPVLP